MTDEQNDLPERLRRYMTGDTSGIRAEAADEIERLRAVLDKWGIVDESDPVKLLRAENKRIYGTEHR